MKNKAKTKIISIFAVMVVLASAFGIIVMAANSMGEDTTTTEKTVDECHFYAHAGESKGISTSVINSPSLVKGTLYAKENDSGRHVLIHAWISSDTFTNPVIFITLTPGWNVTNAYAENETGKVKLEIIVEHESPTPESDSVIARSRELPLGQYAKGDVYINIEPKDPNNPQNECWIAVEAYGFVFAPQTRSSTYSISCDSATVNF